MISFFTFFTFSSLESLLNLIFCLSPHPGHLDFFLPFLDFRRFFFAHFSVAQEGKQDLEICCTERDFVRPWRNAIRRAFGDVASDDVQNITTVQNIGGKRHCSDGCRQSGQSEKEEGWDLVWGLFCFNPKNKNGNGSDQHFRRSLTHELNVQLILKLGFFIS